MLQITDQAAALLKEARAQLDTSHEGGARLSAEQTPEGLGIGIGFVEEPEDTDQVIEQSGMRVFVANELTATLDDKTLDAEATAEGTRLLLREEAGGTP